MRINATATMIPVCTVDPMRLALACFVGLSTPNAGARDRGMGTLARRPGRLRAADERPSECAIVMFRPRSAVISWKSPIGPARRKSVLSVVTIELVRIGCVVALIRGENHANRPRRGR